MTSLLDTKIKRFIEKNIASIEAEDWERVYEKALPELTAPQIGDFTQALLEADINPLESTTIIPNYYLYASTIQSLNIPDNIKIISECAFQYCRKLVEVHLPKDLTEIKPQAFASCIKLKDFYYPGTKEEWEEVFLRPLWAEKYLLNRIIHCSNGDIQLD